MTRFFLVCLGGAVGSGARYLTALWALSVFGSSFPAGTLIVNVVGSFLIAFVMELSATTTLISPDVRVLLATGVVGGFTTYSAFNYETTSALRNGAWLLGAINVAATVIGCLAAGWAGLALARAFAR